MPNTKYIETIFSTEKIATKKWKPNMSEESERQFGEALQQNAEMMRTLNISQIAMVDIMKQLAKAQGVQVSSLNTFDQALRKANDTVKQSELYKKSENQALEKYLQAKANETAATASAVTSLKSLTTAFLGTEKGFTKFGSGLTSAGDAAWQIGKNFGILGMAIGGLAKGATEVTSAAFKQADASLKATDQLAALGGAGGFTAKEVLNMGHKAGLTSANLEVFTKAAAKAGSGLGGFGLTAADGIKAFSEMTAVTKEQRMAFQRLGISQEQLMEMQGDYVKLQELSGRSLQGQGRDTAKLRQESLAYVENLTRLSALTGKSADRLQKEQDKIDLEYEEIVQTRIESDKIRQLRKEGHHVEANALEQEQKNRKAYLKQMSAVIGPEAAMQLAHIARTGGFDSRTKGQAVLGVDPGQIARDIKSARTEDEARTNAAAYSNTYKDLVSKGVLDFGPALMYRGKGLGNNLGLGEEVVQETSKYMGRDEVDALNKARQQTRNGGAASSKDPAAIARGELTEAEIAAKTKLDELLASVNPLMLGFTATTVAATALTAAALAASAALTYMGAKAKIGQLLGGAGTPGPGSSGKIGKLLGGLKGVGIGALGGLALGYAGDKATEAGHYKTAAGLDIGSSVATGAGFGAMLGPMGAVAGGALGGAYGLYKNWGKMFGGSGAIGDSSSESKAKEEQDKAIEREKEQIATSKNLDLTSQSTNRQLDLNTKALDALRVAIEDLTTVSTIKDATGSAEQKQRAMAEIYNRRGIGAGGASSSGGGYSGGGSAAGGSASNPSISVAEKDAKEVVDAGPGFTVIKTGTGEIQRREGARNWRNNNPGNLEYGDFAKRYGAIGTDGRFAVFPNYETGMKAKEDLLFGPNSKYAGLSIRDAIFRYAPPSENNSAMYAAQVATAAGVDESTLMSTLTPGQRQAMLSKINQVEGFKAGKVVSAAGGAEMFGPSSGFPVNLTAHGNEIIVPLNPNTLLTKLAKEPLSTYESSITNNMSGSPASSDMMMGFMDQFREMMESKFDDMISVMEENNNISDKILTYTKA